MTIYEKQISSGEGWFKSSDNKKISCNMALSSFAKKYLTVAESLCNDLSSNIIKKMDIIQDIIFVETPNGYFLDKFEISGDLPIPLNNYDNHREFLTSESIDYWYEEKDKKIYTFLGKISSSSIFSYEICQFDMLKNLYTVLDTLYANLSVMNITYADPIKICYNPETKTFNASNLVQIESLSSVNLLSVNFKNAEKMEISEVNVVKPI